MAERAKNSIILVEDDPDLRESIVQYLTLKGHDVCGVGTAIDFYREVGDGSRYVLAILDLALPDQDGLILANYLRSNTQMRIVMLTARTSLEERLAGYDAGADVYMVKPVDFRELAATLTNLLDRIDRECGQFAPPLSRAEGPWRLERTEWELTTPQGRHVKLTAKEYAFLDCLISSDESIVQRERIMQCLGYERSESGNRSLESLVYRLRKKISPELDTPIKTANGSGYSFTAPHEVI